VQRAFGLSLSPYGDAPTAESRGETSTNNGTVPDQVSFVWTTEKIHHACIV